MTSDTLDNVVIRGLTHFSFSEAIWTSFVGLLIWIVLYVYVDQVLPREFGVPKRWNFFLTRAWWNEVMGWQIATAGDNGGKGKVGVVSDAAGDVVENGARTETSGGERGERGERGEKREQGERVKGVEGAQGVNKLKKVNRVNTVDRVKQVKG